jgi:hypothetical protein
MKKDASAAMSSRTGSYFALVAVPIVRVAAGFAMGRKRLIKDNNCMVNHQQVFSSRRKNKCHRLAKA